MAKYPSIFNDVIGPVMRGPSSSHCAASLRIGRICRDLMNGDIRSVHIVYDTNGSLATTHDGQGSDMGLFGGFQGWNAHDERLINYRDLSKKSDIQIEIETAELNDPHPNTYNISLNNSAEIHKLVALSTGGGMIEVIKIDGAPLELNGDFCETLIFCQNESAILTFIEERIDFDEVNVCNGDQKFIQIKSQQFPSAESLAEISNMDGVKSIRKINPVLPILSRKQLTVPFITCQDMLNYNQDQQKSLWELAIDYEQIRGNLSSEEVIEQMREIARLMRKSIESGLAGTDYNDRILPAQSPRFKEKMENKQLPAGEMLNRIIMYTSAMMEVKSSMGVIVAAPTAGSCGTLPGAVFGVADSLKLTEDDIIKALLSAGMIGVFITAHATFAAEVGGCMAETGSAGGMAAAAIVQMNGGTLDQSLTAASIALQNSLGLICDPVANRVEAPCLGKNVSAASNALSSANMALADFTQLIPLDEVIQTMKSVGDAMPNTHRCTGLGGLAMSNTAKRIEKELAEKYYRIC
ncbi:MAG: L-serine ammonia-lyase, iron-sulfur-dependent, subunit alpha [Calditrichaeota bacterium]|nr:L-serine ammonia-lyase, iron-sulfur-dependent, subunit alpha [Calditrichota bacterium]